jgi:HlyD family secretion protein
MKKKWIPIAALVAVIIVALAAYFWWKDHKASREDWIKVSGNIEVTDTEVSFKIPGKVEARVVSEGQVVRAEDLVARLESRELAQEVALRRAQVRAAQAQLTELSTGSLPEEIAQAEAAYDLAQARLKELETGARPQELAAAEAAFERARSDLEKWRLEYARQENLFRKEVISAREREAIQNAFEAARTRHQEALEHLKLVREGPRREQIEQARAAARQAKEHLTLVIKGPRREAVDRARAGLDQAHQALAQAETRLAYTRLLAPVGGMVLSENVEAGEYVSAGTPVVTIGDLDKVWLRAYISETDLGRVKVGQRVRLTTDTFPGKVYEGRITFLSSQAEFTPKNVQTQKERVKLVYRIKVEFPNPNLELKPGMPADARIYAGH